MYYKDIENHPNFCEEKPPGGYKHFAIGYLGKSKIIGHNRRVTNPNFVWTQAEGDPISTIHAEIDVLRQVPAHKTHKLKIFVTRIRKNKKAYYLKNSKPCTYCIDFMLSAGVKLRNIWYTDSSGEWVCLKDNYGDGDAIKNRSQQSSSYQKAKEINLRKRYAHSNAYRFSSRAF